MIGPLAALTIAATPPRLDPSVFDARLSDSSAAAQALQGPLDGTWTLYDAGRRPLYVFQITDPAGGAGGLEAAWRGPGASSEAGVATNVVRRGARLSITFSRSGGSRDVIARLTGRGAGRWTGWLTENGHTRRATLVRVP